MIPISLSKQFAANVRARGDDYVGACKHSASGARVDTTKRALADAVLTADKGGLATIGRAELELLLGPT